MRATSHPSTDDGSSRRIGTLDSLCAITSAALRELFPVRNLSPCRRANSSRFLRPVLLWSSFSCLLRLAVTQLFDVLPVLPHLLPPSDSLSATPHVSSISPPRLSRIASHSERPRSGIQAGQCTRRLPGHRGCGRQNLAVGVLVRRSPRSPTPT